MKTYSTEALCKDLAASVQIKDFEYAKQILAELRSRIAEAEFPDYPEGEQR